MNSQHFINLDSGHVGLATLKDFHFAYQTQGDDKCPSGPETCLLTDIKTYRVGLVSASTGLKKVSNSSPIGQIISLTGSQWVWNTIKKSRDPIWTSAFLLIWEKKPSSWFGVLQSYRICWLAMKIVNEAAEIHLYYIMCLQGSVR